jgi:hypothetical protein
VCLQILSIAQQAQDASLDHVREVLTRPPNVDVLDSCNAAVSVVDVTVTDVTVTDAEDTACVDAAAIVAPVAGPKQRKHTRASKASMLSRKTPLYNNTALLSPSGLVLARIERKKVKWYLDRQLAVAEYDAAGNVTSLTLLKEPNGAIVLDWPDSERAVCLVRLCVVCCVLPTLPRFPCARVALR